MADEKSVDRKNCTSGIRYHDRAFILIPRLWPGYQEFRFIVTTQTKRVNYSWFIEDARGLSRWTRNCFTNPPRYLPQALFAACIIHYPPFSLALYILFRSVPIVLDGVLSNPIECATHFTRDIAENWTRIVDSVTRWRSNYFRLPYTIASTRDFSYKKDAP